MKGFKNPINFFKVRKFRKKQSNFGKFPYSRFESLYAVVNGKGKTISCCKEILNICSAFPNCIFISNVEIKGINNKTFYFSNTDELVDILKSVVVAEERNGYLIFIDEIHVVLAELFGRTDPIFLTFLSQQRKLSIYILGTSQMYNKCPRVIRDYLRQSGQIILCNNWFKAIQVNKLLNMDDIEENSKNNLVWHGCRLDWFFHTIDLYECYNTFAVISQIKGLLNKDLRRLDYDDRLSVDYGDITEK